jgi:protein-S-isoprenylcysteine O-methyltransferase Ste14
MAMRDLAISYGDFLFKYRNIIFPSVLLALFVGFTPIIPWDDFALDDYVDFIGILLAGLGQTIRVAVIGLVYIKRGGLNKMIHADTLVTEGIFAHVRNPLYVGNLLILFGLFIIHNNPWVYGLGSFFFLTAYSAIVTAEEAFLGRKFGAEYTAYCQTTGRWLPRVHGLRDTLHSMQFNWRRVVLKDYASTYTWMVTATLLMAYEAIVHAGWSAVTARLEHLGEAFFVLTVIFLTVRTLKKRHILREISR